MAMPKGNEVEQINYQGRVGTVGVMSTSVMFSSLLGFASCALIANYFGLSKITDALFMAQSLPLIFAKFFQTAPFPKIFIPIFMDSLNKDINHGRYITYNMLNIFLCFLGVFIALFIIFAPLVVQLIAPGFDKETKRLTIILVRFLMPTLLFIVVSGIFISILHSFNRFATSAILDLVLPLSELLSVFLFTSKIGIYSVVFGILFGSILQVILLYLFVDKVGIRYKFCLNLKMPELKRILKQLFPFTFSSLAIEAQLVTSRLVSSLLMPGSLTALSYAEKFYRIFSSMFVNAIPTIIFPDMVRKASSNRLGELRSLILKGSKAVTFVVLPIVIGTILLSPQLIRLLFERGSFDSIATHKIAIALMLIMLGLFPQGIVNILNRALFSLNQTNSVVKALILAQLLTIITNFSFAYFMGYAGLALSYAFNVYILLIFYYLFLNKELKKMNIIFLNATILKIAFGSLLTGFICFMTKNLSFLRPLGVDGIIPQSVKIIVIIMVGVISYGFLTYSVRVEGAILVYNFIFQKIIRVKNRFAKAIKMFASFLL